MRSLFLVQCRSMTICQYKKVTLEFLSGNKNPCYPHFPWFLQAEKELLLQQVRPPRIPCTILHGSQFHGLVLATCRPEPSPVAIICMDEQIRKMAATSNTSPGKKDIPFCSRNHALTPITKMDARTYPLEMVWRNYLPLLVKKEHPRTLPFIPCSIRIELHTNGLCNPGMAKRIHKQTGWHYGNQP